MRRDVKRHLDHQLQEPDRPTNDGRIQCHPEPPLRDRVHVRVQLLLPVDFGFTQPMHPDLPPEPVVA